MSDPSHYVPGDTVIGIARAAGIADMLTEAQWESLVVAIAESRENYDLTLVHCLLVDAAGDVAPDMTSFRGRICSGYAPGWGGLQIPSV